MSEQRPRFEFLVLASGLVTRDQLTDVLDWLKARWRENAPTSLEERDKQIADALVEAGYINAWQAKQLLAGRTRFNLGQYRVIDSLGRGGIGQVFLAEHLVLKRRVAIKVLPREKCTPEGVENFLREVRLVAQLDHPNLVRALDAGEDGQVHYLVLEYVEGQDLRKLVQATGPLPVPQAATVIAQVAAGLDYAHRRGLVHRDVKPGNVLVGSDLRTKLSDLGLASPLTGEALFDSRLGRIAGTADYVSPDQVRNPWDPNPAWDIYSLGCTLYFAVTGSVPFPGGTSIEKVRAHCERLPLDPRRVNPELDDEFVELIGQMMSKDPKFRLASAQEVILRLARWADLTYLPGEYAILLARARATVGQAESKPPVAISMARWTSRADALPAGNVESAEADVPSSEDESALPDFPKPPISRATRGLHAPELIGFLPAPQSPEPAENDAGFWAEPMWLLLLLPFVIALVVIVFAEFLKLVAGS